MAVCNDYALNQLYVLYSHSSHFTAERIVLRLLHFITHVI